MGVCLGCFRTLARHIKLAFKVSRTMIESVFDYEWKKICHNRIKLESSTLRRFLFRLFLHFRLAGNFHLLMDGKCSWGMVAAAVPLCMELSSIFIVVIGWEMIESSCVTFIRKRKGREIREFYFD